MDANFLKIYLDQNLLLAKTLTIKSEISASLINDKLKLIYGASYVDYNDKNSWKYYLNISGNYHKSDKIMKIISLDTLEEIELTKDNLSIHIATADAYKFGTRYYYSLLNKYKEQEQLILGILYPCDIDYAIESENGTILSYPDYLVEKNEITLIDELEKYIKRYLIRWDIPAFSISDSLYSLAQHATMYLNIYLKLLNLRLRRCKTYEANSFHVKQYLASHSGLDKYYKYMSLRQSLYLYRNLPYIERNSGKIHQFIELVKILLTNRNIPLDEITIRQLNTFDINNYPNIVIRNKAINSQLNTVEKKYSDIDTLFNKESLLLSDNSSYLDANKNKITSSMKNSYSSIVQTKDLESVMIDYTDAVPDPITAILIREWISMANKNLYIANINFKDPKSLEMQTLSAKDAFIYMFYITMKSFNIELTDTVGYVNIKSRKHTLPSLNEIRSISNLKSEKIDYYSKYILDNQPALVTCISVSSFNDLVNLIYDESLKHWFITSNLHDLEERAYISNMINMLYEIEYIDLIPNDNNINEWLSKRNLNEYDYNYNQATELIKNITVAATGATDDSDKLIKNIQQAMISIFRQLSSYSVQFLNFVNLSSIKPLNWSAIRIGNIKNSTEANNFVNENITMLSNYALVHDFKDITTDYAGYSYTYSFNLDYKYNIINTALLLGKVIKYDKASIYINSFKLNAEYEEKDLSISSLSAFIGYEFFTALTVDQQKSIKSIY